MSTAEPIFLDVEQRSPEWLASRVGIVTASRLADVCAKLKNGKSEAAARRDYRIEVLTEILTGQPAYHFVSREMQWGIDQEPFAQAAYECAAGVLVEPAGLVLHPTIARYGASPDGLIGADGVLQCKCPKTETHIDWMLSGTIPLEHAPQMLGEMDCTGRQWCDFVSYDPRLPYHLQLYVRRFHRDDDLIAVLQSDVTAFNDDIDTLIASLPKAT